MQEDKPVSAFESTTVASEQGDKQDVPPPVEHKGTVIMDATCCPQDIAYPTDLTLLSAAREKAEELIDFLYDKEKHVEIKPRTYRKEARKTYLHTAQKKNKSKKEVRKAVGKQLRYLRRDISIIHSLLDEYRRLPFNRHQLRYFYVIQTLYDQQIEMYEKHTHTVEHRIVSMHQPHVRPIVRGKAQAKVEFGAKIHVTMIDGITFLDEISWDAFNEGSHLETYVEQYYERYKFYPRLLLADQIYCTRVNRLMLKAKGIALRAKPLGRPSLSAALSNHVSPGERNPIEGKFGQGKTAYGMNPYQGASDRHKSIVDSEHRAGAKPRQTGGGSACTHYCQNNQQFNSNDNPIYPHSNRIFGNKNAAGRKYGLDSDNERWGLTADPK